MDLHISIPESALLQQLYHFEHSFCQLHFTKLMTAIEADKF